MKTNKLLMCTMLIAFCTIWTGCEQEEPQIGPTKSETIPEGFSVSSTKRVQFSKGNLCYINKTLYFLPNQYDFLGTYNFTDGVMDIFCWGSGDDPTGGWDKYNYNTSFTDWGTNMIYDGTTGNFWSPNCWRTLTQDEWEYLLFSRLNASSLCGFGTVNGVHGLIIMPDNFTSKALTDIKWCSLEKTKSVGSRGWSDNIYTKEQWFSLEKEDAVFLPAAGSGLYGHQWVYEDEVQNWGFYWSSTEYEDEYSSSKARCIGFSCFTADLGGYTANRYCNCSVRLVKDLKN